MRLNHTLKMSPDCDTILLGGDRSYKYVWAAGRRGWRAFLPDAGTPGSIEFSLQGDTIAIVNHALAGYLVSPRLEVRCQGASRDLPVRWPSQALPGLPAGAVDFLRADVEELFEWLPRGRKDTVSDDGTGGSSPTIGTRAAPPTRSPR